MIKAVNCLKKLALKSVVYLQPTTIVKKLFKIEINFEICEKALDK